MDVELPNGKIIHDIPDGTNKNDIMRKAISSGLATSEDFGLKPGNKSTWAGRFATGLRDPIVGAAQLLQNSLPENNLLKTADSWLYDKTGGTLGYKNGDINEAIKQRELQYKAELPKNEGFDEARMLGNMATSILGTKGIGAPQSAIGALGQGAMLGGGLSATAPVTNGDYWNKKKEDVSAGALLGGIVGPIGYGLGRVISPKFTNRQAVSELNKEGVNPTIGQTMGGIVDDIEQKATSLPFVGKSISNARKSAQNEYNNAILNKVVEPLGGKVTTIGTDGIKQAKNQISQAYKNASNMIKGVNLDDTADASINLLKANTKYLKPSEKRIFDRFIKDEVEHFLSPARGMTSETFKKVDSRLNTEIAKKTGDLQGALKELQSILKSQAERTNPQYKSALDAADSAYARLVRAENASAKSGLQGGVFTPGQMVNAIKASDKSIRKNQFASGDSLMQDFAVKGQNILGDTVPDSGTFGRMAVGGGLLGGGIADLGTSGAITGGLLTGAALYTPAMQKLLINAATKRPQAASFLAPIVSKTAPLLPASFMMSN